MLYGNATLFRAEPTTGSGGARRNRWRRVNGQGPPLHPEGDGSQLYWSGVIKNYARALEESTSSLINVGGARRSHYRRGCVCVCLGHKATCFVFVLVFLFFDNLMLEFFQMYVFTCTHGGGATGKA